MKILITGNQGYIGPVVAEHLKKKNTTIVGLDTGYFSNCDLFSGLSAEHFVDLQMNKDVRHITKEDLKDIDHIVYLAAISNDPMGNEFEKITEEINQKSAVRLAQIAKEVGVQSFVFASSCSVYGAAGDGEFRHEDSELNPVTAYAQSKINAEFDLIQVADENIKITCLRFATACGFSPRLRLDLVLNDFVASAIITKNINILSDGMPWRPLIHVKDMARAIEWAIVRDKSTGHFLSLNVGDDNWNYQIIDLAKTVQQLIPGTIININKDAVPDKRSYRVSFRKFKMLAPNYIPIVSLEDTINELKNEMLRIGQNICFNEDTIRLYKIRELIRIGYLDDSLLWKNKNI